MNVKKVYAVSEELKLQMNDDVVCVLKLVGASSMVELDYLSLKKFFSKEISILEKMCNDNSSSLLQILSFLEESPVFYNLNKLFDYCEKLEGAFQDKIEGKHGLMLTYIMQQEMRINFLYKINDDDAMLRNSIYLVKNTVLYNYKNWVRLYCIEETVKALKNDASVLVFSHRKIGWKDRPYALTPNMSVQIAKNFGYGRSSYFLLK